MAITAIALLRIAPPADKAPEARITQLEDAILLHTKANFASDPAALSRIVREQLGEAVDDHPDPRGILFIPSVAAPTARTYEAVVEEVGEGGQWGPVEVEPAQMLGAAAMGGGLGALLGSLLQQMPSGVLDSVTAAARGEPGALEAATSQLKAAGDDGQLDVAGLQAMLDHAGIDMNSMSALMGQMESMLANDPEKAAALAEQFFGAVDEENLEDDEEDVEEEDEDDEDDEDAEDETPR